ncbi:MAG TPA: type IV toxin-antitoxin system AbiEi family antitoxin [Fulvivirga sp.]|nr:type IV toxin-antitoxin system AbiEi family antitoxin [Fulvivirga sp.]
MNDKIVHIALDNLKKGTGIKGIWTERQDIDGEIKLTINSENLHYFVEVKREVRPYQIAQLLKYQKQFTNVLLIAERIFPKVKEELRDLNFPYLETNGNIFIKKDSLWLWIDNNRIIDTKKKTGNRAFTKTGLKVLFHLLLHKDNINLPQRIIAKETGVALGNIPLVINGLKETGYLLQKDRKTYSWKQKEELIDRWITEYETTLKPHLLMGRFHLPTHWQQLELNEFEEVWGGEPAGDILTNYLRPEEYTLFTKKNRTDFIKMYKLRPDQKGELEVYEMFWRMNQEKQHLTAPPLLVYADLKLKNNKRCRETAELIWNEHIQPNI